MRKYNSRVISVEKGTFTPLVYTTFGGCGPQATRYHKRLAQLIARKRNEDYHHVINHIRVKVRFSLLRSVLIAVRGERGRKTTSPLPISSTAFNLIPEAMQYECYQKLSYCTSKQYLYILFVLHYTCFLNMKGWLPIPLFLTCFYPILTVPYLFLISFCSASSQK